MMREMDSAPDRLVAILESCKLYSESCSSEISSGKIELYVLVASLISDGNEFIRQRFENDTQGCWNQVWQPVLNCVAPVLQSLVNNSLSPTTTLYQKGLIATLHILTTIIDDGTSGQTLVSDSKTNDPTLGLLLSCPLSILPKLCAIFTKVSRATGGRSSMLYCERLLGKMCEFFTSVIRLSKRQPAIVDYFLKFGVEGSVASVACLILERLQRCDVESHWILVAESVFSFLASLSESRRQSMDLFYRYALYRSAVTLEAIDDPLLVFKNLRKIIEAKGVLKLVQSGRKTLVTKFADERFVLSYVKGVKECTYGADTAAHLNDLVVMCAFLTCEASLWESDISIKLKQASQKLQLLVLERCQLERTLTEILSMEVIAEFGGAHRLALEALRLRLAFHFICLNSSTTHTGLLAVALHACKVATLIDSVAPAASLSIAPYVGKILLEIFSVPRNFVCLPSLLRSLGDTEWSVGSGSLLANALDQVTTSIYQACCAVTFSAKSFDDLPITGKHVDPKLLEFVRYSMSGYNDGLEATLALKYAQDDFKKPLQRHLGCMKALAYSQQPNLPTSQNFQRPAPPTTPGQSRRSDLNLGQRPATARLPAEAAFARNLTTRDLLAQTRRFALLGKLHGRQSGNYADLTQLKLTATIFEPVAALEKRPSLMNLTRQKPLPDILNKLS